MQLFSADATMFSILFFVFFFENMKKSPSKVAHNRPRLFFLYCQPAQIQPKSQFLFHKNCSPRDLCIKTLRSRGIYLLYLKSRALRDVSELTQKRPFLLKVRFYGLKVAI